MSTWSILPRGGSPETVVFSSAAGSVSRAEVERLAREQVASGVLSPGGLHDPLGLLIDLLAAWSAGSALVLGGGGQRTRARSPRRPLGPADTHEFLVDPAQVVVEMFTSGTTGRAERHEKTAGQLLGEAQVLARLLELEPGSVVLSTVSLHHLYGLLFGLLAPIRAAATIAHDSASDPSRFHPHRVAAAVRDFGVTHLITIPAHVQSLCDAAAPLSGLRQVVSSAAALPVPWARELERLSGARVIDVLGSTESGGIAYRRTALGAGYRPLPGVSVSTGDEGRLAVTSPFVGGPGALETGDRVRLLDDGTFEHLGRDDGVVKVGGRRFSLQELEVAARAVPSVTDVVAFARATQGARGTEVWLAVASESITRPELLQELAQRVDPVLMPRRIRILRRLPRDERGKVPRALQRYLSLPGFDLIDVTWSPFRLAVRLREDSARLVGHFPGAPVLPAVAGLLDLVVPEVERLSGRRVQGARRLKWTAPVLPGQTILLTFAAESAAGYRFRWSTNEGVTVASGILSLDDEIKVRR